MKVSEIMSEGIISVDVSDSIKTVAKCMKENDIGSLPVFENGAPLDLSLTVILCWHSLMTARWMRQFQVP